MQEKIDLDLIDPNPYQPRQGEDLEHIQKIAASIAQEGLMQTPVGRRVDGRIQLAFGHSRLAAFKLLNQVGYKLSIHQPIEFEDDSLMERIVLGVDQSLERGILFSRIPVDVREIGDEDMFRLAIGENLARKDLSPIEEAKAMAVYRDQFEKTSEEIGALFGLSGAAVRGKIRLLQLPEDLQTKLIRVPESVLRDLLYMLDLPEWLRKRAEEHWESFIKPSLIIESAIAGEPSDNTHSRITQLVMYWGKELDGKTWKDDQALEGEEIIGLCKGCEHQVKRDGSRVCLNRSCFLAKGKAVKREYLLQASQACGIPVAEDIDIQRYNANTFGYGSSGKAQLETARGVNCPNLCLIYDDSEPWKDNDWDRVPGFPHAAIVCGKRKGYCTCQRAMDADVDLRRAVAARQEPAGDEESPAQEAPVTLETLKEISRETVRQKRQNAAEFRAIHQDASKRFAEALESLNPAVWQLLARRLDWHVPEIEKEKMSIEDLLLTAGQQIADAIYNREASDPNPHYALTRFNQAFKEAGLPELESHLDD